MVFPSNTNIGIADLVRSLEVYPEQEYPKQVNQHSL